MSNQNDLLLSILAMDAYNRGYDVGINMPTVTLGDTTVGDDSTKILKGADVPASYEAFELPIGIDRGNK